MVARLEEGHRCSTSEWDSNIETVASRVILPLFFLSCVAAVLLIGWDLRRKICDLQADIVPNQPAEAGTRLRHLDFARILCIGCVVVDHSGGKAYTHDNVLWVLQWVMPFLFSLSGFCWMLSKSPFGMYLGKLAIFFVFGVCCNWVADAITGHNWQEDFVHTVFQMAYVFFLIVLSFFTYCLRSALRWRHASPKEHASWHLLAMLLLHGTFCLAFFGLYISGSMTSHETIPFQLAQIEGVHFLCLLGCITGTDGRQGWILVALIFLPRILSPFSFATHTMHGAQLYILGMFLERFPLQGRKLLAAGVRGYWPFMLGVLTSLSSPESEGRCDLNPARSWWYRLRFNMIECVLVVCFLSHTFEATDPLELTPSLNLWAVWAYCTHEAVDRLLPVTPWGIVITYSSAPCFFVYYRYTRRKRPQKVADARTASPPDRIQASEQNISASPSDALEVGEERTCSVVPQPHMGGGRDTSLYRTVVCKPS